MNAPILRESNCARRTLSLEEHYRRTAIRRGRSSKPFLRNLPSRAAQNKNASRPENNPKITQKITRG
jgi:hypothetical protein